MSFSSSRKQFYRNRLAFSHFFRLHVLSECPEPYFSTAYCHLSNTSFLAREREVSIFVDNQKASLPPDVYSRTSRHPSRELKLNLFSLQSLHASHFVFTVKHARGQRSIVALFWGSSRRDALAILIFGSAELFRLGAMRLTNTNDTKPGL